MEFIPIASDPENYIPNLYERDWIVRLLYTHTVGLRLYYYRRVGHFLFISIACEFI